MISVFTSIVQSCKDIPGKLRQLSAAAGARALENRQLMQQRGFCSVPKSGDLVAFLQSGNLVFAFASDSSDRPALAEGETSVYASSSCYVILRPDGSIAIKAPLRVDIESQLHVTGVISSDSEVRDSIGTMSHLRAVFNQHPHTGNLGSPTTPPLVFDEGVPI